MQVLYTSMAQTLHTMQGIPYRDIIYTSHIIINTYYMNDTPYMCGCVYLCICLLCLCVCVCMCVRCVGPRTALGSWFLPSVLLNQDHSGFLSCSQHKCSYSLVGRHPPQHCCPLRVASRRCGEKWEGSPVCENLAQCSPAEGVERHQRVSFRVLPL